MLSEDSAALLFFPLTFIVAILIGATLIAGCGQHNEAITTPPHGNTPPGGYQLLKSVAIGSGEISPYKLLPSPVDPATVYLLTGQGESSGISYLYTLSEDTLHSDIPPLKVGADGSALCWISGRIVVLARDSQNIFLIDPKTQTVLDSASVSFPPIAVSALSGGHVVVTSVNSPDMLVFDTSDGKLHLSLRGKLSTDTTSYGIVASSDGNSFFVTQPQGHVVQVDASTLQIVHTYNFPTSPSFGIMIWNGHLVSTDRDGYLDIVDLNSMQQQQFDLVQAYGLDRRTLLPRAIDPTDLIALDASRIAVISARQNSIVLNLTDSNAFRLAPTAQIRSGAYAGLLAGAQQLLLTVPSANRIVRTNVPPAGSTGDWTSVTVITGTGIAAATRIESGSQAYVVAIDSANTLHFVSESPFTDQFFIAGVEDTWAPPFAQGALPDTVLLQSLTKSDGSRHITSIDIHGNEVSSLSLQGGMSPLFSLRTYGGIINAISRLNGMVQFFDTESGSSYVIHLSHMRPRYGIGISNGEWLIIHDTNPDIGITVGRNDQESSFVPYGKVIHAHLSDIIPWNDSYSVAVSFAGDIALVNPGGAPIKVLAMPIGDVIAVRDMGDGTAWMLSTGQGEALQVSIPDFRIQSKLNIDNVQELLPIPRGNMFWTVDDKTLSLYDKKPQ